MTPVDGLFVEPSPVSVKFPLSFLRTGGAVSLYARSVTNSQHSDAHGGTREPLMIIAPETRRAFHRFDALLPPEYRAELIAGEIIVNPPPHGNHEQIFAKLNGQLVKSSAIDVEVSGHRGLETPLGDFIPDMTVTVPDTFGEAPPWGGVRRESS
jgi:hypothetical protein